MKLKDCYNLIIDCKNNGVLVHLKDKDIAVHLSKSKNGYRIDGLSIQDRQSIQNDFDGLEVKSITSLPKYIDIEVIGLYNVFKVHFLKDKVDMFYNRGKKHYGRRYY